MKILCCNYNFFKYFLNELINILYILEIVFFKGNNVMENLIDCKFQYCIIKLIYLYIGMVVQVKVKLCGVGDFDIYNGFRRDVFVTFYLVFAVGIEEFGVVFFLDGNEGDFRLVINFQFYIGFFYRFQFMGKYLLMIS